MNSVSSKGIAILGSTGSVGQHTLDVVRNNKSLFHVVALSANKSVDQLFQQIQEFAPKYVVLGDEQAAQELSSKITSLQQAPELLVGNHHLDELVTLVEVDVVMAAIVGGAGLSSTLSAAQAGKTIFLANKESLVMAGELLIQVARDHQATLLPIDSEHNAVFQCMENNASESVRSSIQQITLTASGGPFLNTPLEKLSAVTPAQACAHPNWSMGQKISVDSATMMNKGLEVIEAALLFSLPVSAIQVVIHPQSIIHALVAYKDGSTLAHLGYPDMRVPIAHALGWPTRIVSGVDILDITEFSGLEFFMPDLQKFPCLALALDVSKTGGTAPVIMNAANEIAVEAFLADKIRFTDIYAVVQHMLNQLEPVKLESVELVMDVDMQTRAEASNYIKGLIH